MAVIRLRLSGGTDNETASASLGGAMATGVNAVIISGSMNNLFDNVTKAENFAGTSDHRVVYIHNDTATAGQIFASGTVYSGNTPAALYEFAIGAVNSVATLEANELAAPAVTFAEYTSAAPLSIPATLEPGDFVPLYIRRTADNIPGAGTITDSLIIVVRGVD